MVPLRLHLRNFMSYVGTTTIELDGLSLACLSGGNGAGKSALLDAMTWAIWGKSRAPSDRNLISIGEEETEVTLELRVANREYRIMRRRTSSRSTLEFDSRNPGRENWLPMTGDSISDTGARIVGELRLDYDTFANSAFLRQGQADLFTQNRPGERKRILAEILGLTEYDGLASHARAERGLRRQRLDVIQARLGEIDLRLADRHGVEVTLAERDEESGLIQQQLGDLRAEIESLAVRLSAANTSRNLLERSTARCATVQEQVAVFEQQRVVQIREIQERESLISAEDAIRRKLQTARDWRETFDRQAAALAARQPLVEQSLVLKKKVDDAEARLAQKLALQKQAIRTLNTRIDASSELGSKIATVQADLDANRSRLEILDATTTSHDELQARSTELSNENASLKSRMNEIREVLTELSAGSATCPVCRSPLSPNDHERLQREWTEEGTRLGDTWRKNRTEINTVSSALDVKRKEIDELRAISRKTSGLEVTLGQLEKESLEVESLRRELTNATDEERRISASLESEDFMANERRRFRELADEIERLGYDESLHTESRRNSADLDELTASISRIERARGELELQREQLAVHEGRLAELAEEQATLAKDIEELTTVVNQFGGIQTQHDSATKDLARLEARLTHVEQGRGGLRRQIEELDNLESEAAALNTELASVAAELDAYGELNLAFGRNGIQAMVIENVIPELEDETNRILARMTHRHITVSFRTTRQAVSSDSQIETLDIIIRDESGERPYQLFSGGEAFRINFAIRIALSKLLAKRAGSSVDTLIIDEGFGTQDQQGRDGLVEALQSVADEFELILVITHVDELRFQFPNRIEITKTDQGSRATLV